MDKKEIIALIKEVGHEQNGCINSDGEYVDFCKGDEEYVFDNEDVNELAEKLIKLFSLHLVSKCQHPYKKVISGDDGMWCTECNKYITTF